jgi:hypothetical protein
MVLNIQPVEELPGIATDALCGRLDSQALRVLAGSSPTEPAADLWQLFRKAAAELHIPVPDKIGAARRVLRLHLRDLVDGRVSPAEGVRRILDDVQYPVGHSLDKAYVGEGLGIGRLVGDYYTYDDAPSGRLEFEGRRLSETQAIKALDHSIVEEARRLLQNAARDASPNGGPAGRLANSDTGGGPPSVS